MKENKWIRLLAYVTGLVNQELLLQNEYWAAENRILRAHLPARLRLSHPERSTLAEIGRGTTGAEAEPNHDLAEIYSIAYGGVGQHRFLHGRSAHLAWVGDILRLVLHSPGESACQLGRNQPAS